MTLLFRLDANQEFGFGHLVRCISLVGELRNRKPAENLRIVFAGNFSEPACEMLQQNNIEFVNSCIENEYAFIENQISLLQPSLLYIDKIYGYSKVFVEQIQKQLPVVMMHNLCEATPYCTCFILPSAHTPHEKLSEFGLTRAKPNWFIGAEYIVLNRQVVNAVPITKKGDALQLIVTTGGSDPEKVMKKISGIPMIGIQIERLRKSGIPIVVASSELPENDVLEDYLTSIEIPIFRGSELNVLDRFYHAAKKYHAEYVIRITGDNPLIDGTFLGNTISGIQNFGKRSYFSIGRSNTFPLGFSFELFSFELLEEAYNNAQSPKEKEHVTPYIHQNVPGNIIIKTLYREPTRNGYRLSVDTNEDLILVKTLIENYDCRNKPMDEIIDILDKNPELVAINNRITQKKWNE